MKHFMALFQLYFNARFFEAKLFHFRQVLAKNISMLKVLFKLSIEIWIIAIKLSRSTILNLKISIKIPSTMLWILIWDTLTKLRRLIQFKKLF